MMRALKIAVAIALALLFVVRQFYVNLLGIDRSLFSAVFVVLMTLIGLVFLWHRIGRPSPRFLVVDAIIAAQLILSLVAIGAYWFLGTTNTAITVYAIYFYALAPLLLYSGFYLRRVRAQHVQISLIASSTVFIMMCIAGLFQVIGFDGWLFRNDNFEFQSTFLGTHRATGGYGTQIDFGLLSFIVFVCAFYIARERRSKLAVFMVLVGFGGILLAVSRVFIFAAVCVLISSVRRSTFSRLFRQPKRLIPLAMGMLLVVIAVQQLDLITIFLAADTVTQSSNEDRITFLHNAPRWALRDYPIEGTGPGTQNGPNEEMNKLIGDGLWLAMLIEFGLLVGLPIVLLKMALLVLVVRNFAKCNRKSAISCIACVLAICFLAASVVDSAFANVVSLSIFYVIAGWFLCDYYSERPTELLASAHAA
ncbi:MAG TPA: hypothetical protein VFU50_15670 [Terriglobales bacterium]|nr:hypothetical protein [Terriglobales bacterium]